jgi:spore germination protein KC
MRSCVLRKVAVCLAVSLNSLLLPGCFDIQEVEDMNIVTAIGIDQTDDGLVRVTAQLVNPANVPSAGGGVSGSSGTARSFIIREETGASIEEAVDKFNLNVPHEMYLAHNSLILFGYNYAKHGIDRAFDYMERNRYLRRTQLLLVTSGTANDVLSAPTDPEPLNALGIRSLVEQSGDMVRLAKSDQMQVIKEYLLPSHSPVLSLVDLDPLDHPVMKGVAVFRGSKVADVLTMEETKALGWLVGDTRQADVHLPCDDPVDGVETAVRLTAVRLFNSHTEVVPQLRNNQLSFLVTVNARAEVERLCPHEQMNEETYKQLENKTAEHMKREMQAVVAKLQSDGADACQFGTRLFMKDPRHWRQLSRDWPKYFAAAQVNCNVRVQILRTGLSTSAPGTMASQSGLAPQAGRGVTGP